MIKKQESLKNKQKNNNVFTMVYSLYILKNIRKDKQYGKKTNKTRQ